MNNLSPAAKGALMRLVRDLAAHNYASLEMDGRSGRVTAQELARVIRDYGRTIAELPEEVWPLIDVYPVGGRPGTCMIDIPIWTHEEGRSDLMLSLVLRETADGIELAITDLRVP